MTDTKHSKKAAAVISIGIVLAIAILSFFVIRYVDNSDLSDVDMPQQGYSPYGIGGTECDDLNGVLAQEVCPADYVGMEFLDAIKKAEDEGLRVGAAPWDNRSNDIYHRYTDERQHYYELDEILYMAVMDGIVQEAGFENLARLD